jgi:hypothetical protein
MSEETENIIRTLFERHDSKIQEINTTGFGSMKKNIEFINHQLATMDFRDLTRLLNLLHKRSDDLLLLPHLITNFTQPDPRDIEQVTQEMGLPTVPRTRL